MILSGLQLFQCSRNSDIEQFLKTKAADFDKQRIGRTFLIVDKEKIVPPIESNPIEILAYFTLSSKCVEIGDQVSKSLRKKINANSSRIPAVLLAQVGKNDNASGYNGHELFCLIESFVAKTMNLIAGKLMILECDKVEKLICHYKSLGYNSLGDHNELHQMYKVIDTKICNGES
ncbi:MAG: hypothetical protein AB7E96_06960 [Deferribacterales bacterium]